MQELRLVAVSEDGSYAVLAVPGRSGRFALPIDERLRTVARGQFSRLAQYEIEVESPLRPKEIQDRIRAGETAEEIADAAGLPVDRIRRFEGPPLAERARWAQEAQRATVRGGGDSGPGPRLGVIVAQRLADLGANADDAEWDSRKRPDGSWQVQLAYTVGGRMHVAEWVYDVRAQHVTPDDDEAIRLCLDEESWPQPRPVPKAEVTATVTPIGSRAQAAASHQHDNRHDYDHRGDPDRPAARAALQPPRPAPAVSVSASQAQKTVGAGQAQKTTAASAGSGRVPARPQEQDAAVKKASPKVPVGSETSATAEAPADAPAASVGQGKAQAGRPAKRASGGRSRRSSVPSWDEIMFGTSRQPD